MSTPRRGLVSAVLHIGPAVVYVAAIFVGGSLSGGETYVNLTDKQIHAVAFGVMVPLLVLAIKYVRPGLRLLLQLGAAAGLSSALGALLELWQALLPHRDADVFDWVADTIGAAVAVVAFATLVPFFYALNRADGD